MKKITICLPDDDEYEVPYNKENMEALVTANYDKRSLVLVTDEENDTIGIVSSEILSFYTYDDDSDEKDNTDKNIDTNNTEEKESSEKKSKKSSWSPSDNALERLLNSYKSSSI